MATIREAVNNVDSPVRDYLNPKSAITMGACAAMVLAFTTTLVGAFPFLPAAIVALGLSIMFGWAQVAYLTEKISMKLFYAMICTLIIFNAARGGNLAITDATGTTVSVPPATINLSTNKSSEVPALIDILVPSAYAASDKVDPNKYYFWRLDNDGNAVYTNAQGKVHLVPKVNKEQGKAFKSWTWSK